MAAFTAVAAASLCGCHSPGALEKRKGDEIVAAGQMFHTGARVVLWMDPGGYDAYRVERRFAPLDESDWDHSKEKLHAPNRYGMRHDDLSAAMIERVRGGGWDLPTLRGVVDQFVLHYDAAGSSRTCFKVLQDARGLSVHFMIDVDGTIYQTLDVKERALHASICNDRAIGVEVANLGAYPVGGKSPLERAYRTRPDGRVEIAAAEARGARPARREAVTGQVQGETLRQYDFTPRQYRALAHLTAALCAIFPRIQCDYPRDAQGRLLTRMMSADELKNYHGVLGHYHLDAQKVDPGPALQWDYVIGQARRLLREPALPRDAEGKPMTFRPALKRDN